MKCLIKRVLPFFLTLALGIALWGLVNYFNLHRGATTIEPLGGNTIPMVIVDVPELDFTEAARRTNGFSGSMRLQALLDADGKVSNVKPAEILPSDVTGARLVETETLGHPAPAIMDSKFVAGLPYGLTEEAIEAAKQIRFAPAMRDGKPVSVSITIVDEFNLMTSPDCMDCSSITTTVMDDGIIKWRKHTWRENTYYYKTYPNLILR